MMITPPPPPKRELTYPNLGSHLSDLVDAYEQGSASQRESAEQAAISQGGSVAVTIRLTANVSDVVQFLEDNGGDPRNVGENYIEAYVPVSLLGRLSEQPGVVRVREVIPPHLRYGNFTSQGVAAHLATAWRAAGYSGQGVKVGIIDSGFQGWRQLQGVELPGTVEARCYTDMGVFSTNLAVCDNPDKSRHGTGVAEAVIDIAPDADLYIADPYSRGDLREIVDWMVSQGVQVMNVSLGWPPDGPGDGTSPDPESPLNAVDRAVASGITWVNAGGNDARRVWYGSFTDTDGDEFHEWLQPAIEGQHVTLDEGESISVDLRWEDRWPRATSDLYLDVFDPDTRQVLKFSNDPQSGGSGHNPVEALSFEAPYDGEFWISVRHVSGAVPDWIQLILQGANLPFNTDHNMYSVEESANPGMLAVGAADYWDTNRIASYSSRGPTIDGRTKPEIVGTACARSASYPQHIDSQSNRTCWFRGTSQAAPHVAGLAALVKQTHPAFTPQQVAEYLKNNASRRDSPIPNNTWGYGFAQLPSPPAEIVDPCAAAPLTGDGTTDGTWAAGCQSQHVVTSQHPNIGYARYYSFTLAQESAVTITLESSVDPYLYLRSGDARTGTPLHFNDDVESGNRNSRIVATLAAGRYTIEATTYVAATAGTFTLTVSGLDGTTTGPGPGPGPGPDACSESITADGTTPGTWAAGCQSAETGRGYARYYGFTLSESGPVTITLKSDVDTYLFLRSGDRTGAVAAENDDHGSLINTAACASASGLSQRDSCITVATLAAGDYTIEATTYAVATAGTFTLTISGLDGTTTGPGPGPGPGPDTCSESITADGSTPGTWAAGCQSAETGRGFARYYGFSLSESGPVTITLKSDVDTYLFLRSGGRTGEITARNDDHGTLVNTAACASASGLAQRDSCITVATLAAGDYTIEATTYPVATAGTFTLTVSGLDGTTPGPDPGPGPSPDACGDTISEDGTTPGTWAAGCQSAETGRGYARYYGFSLSESGPVTITLESDVDTYLFLRSGGRTGAITAENDDHGTLVSTAACASASGLSQRDSCITVATLAAGTYTIEATTYNPATAGSFTLTVSGLDGTTTGPDPGPGPGPDTCRESITGDGSTPGTWAAGCQSAETGRGYARYYGFTLSESGPVTITLESDVDTYLFLRSGDRTGSVAAENDDHGNLVDTAACASASGLSQRDSCITVATLAAGDYTIEATTYAVATAGTFTLTISGLGGATSGPGPGPGPGPDACGDIISGDGPTSGTWAAGCQSAETGRGYARYYGFSLSESGPVTITLKSDVDTYLFLRSGSRTGAITAQNDDHGTLVDTAACASASGLSQRDSCITVATLAAGDYTIEATTYAVATAGTFTLTVSGLDGTTTQPTQGGAISVSSTSGSPGSIVTLSGEGFDAFVEVQSVTIGTIDITPAPRPVTDANGMFEFDIFIPDIDAGSQTIEVQVGDTSVSTSFVVTETPTTSCAAAPLTGDGPTNGTWAAGCQSQHVVTNQHPNIGYARYYSFTLSESRAVTITLESEVDPYLYLRSGDARTGGFLHENDDVESRVNLNSRISETLAAGDYTIEATTYAADMAGMFTLTISGLGGG